jgi:hypothetical protein
LRWDALKTNIENIIASDYTESVAKSEADIEALTGFEYHRS